MLAAAELNPRSPIAMHQDHGNSAGHLLQRHRAGLHQRDDGRLADAGRQDGLELRIQREGHARSRRDRPRQGRHGRGRDRQSGRHRGRPRRRRHGPGAPHRPGPGRRSSCRTGVDALAVAIGTSHGAYKFSQKPTGEVLEMDLIEEIHKRLPNTHLVMHGSSSVPQELLDIINKYGGKMKQTYGVPVEEIQRGIKHGVRKINVDTDNRLAITGAIRKVFAEHAEQVRSAQLPGPARDGHEEGVRRPHDRLRPGRQRRQDQGGFRWPTWPSVTASSNRRSHNLVKSRPAHWYSRSLPVRGFLFWKLVVILVPDFELKKKRRSCRCAKATGINSNHWKFRRR